MKYRKYLCRVCGYIYDEKEGSPKQNIAKETAFDDLPEDWVCPKCGADKSFFHIVED